MKKRALLIITILFLSLSVSARPARHGNVIFTQPDGSTFKALIKGDEHLNIKTTLQGHAIVQDEDGWWCYAIFDEDGSRRSSGCRVGMAASTEILSASMRIPYSRLEEKVKENKSATARNRMSRRLSASISSKASKKTLYGVIILAEFKDVKFSHKENEFINLIKQEGYSKNGATGCALEYFKDQFGDNIEFIFDISPIVTLSRNRSYYGGNDEYGDDKNPHVMVYEACQTLESSLDFSRYDGDSDGEIDNIFVFFAGGDEAEGDSEDCIWAHAWYVYDGAEISKRVDGKLINRYACASEITRQYVSDYSDEYDEVMTGIGAFCHEYSHTFGLPDLYDTDYDSSGGYSAAIWYTLSLMDGGNVNNNSNTPPNYTAIEREILYELGYPGMKAPVIINKAGTYTLEPIHKNGQYYRIDSNTDGDYYLIENRSENGWDKYIGGKGMLVYHIDKSGRTAGYSEIYETDMTAAERWDKNEVNCRPSHPCADLIEADGRKDSYYSYEDETYGSYLMDLSGCFFPYGRKNSIEELEFWGSASASWSISSIKRDGENITFYISDGKTASTPPDVTDISIEKFQDAAILEFSSSYAFDGYATVSWGRSGKAAENTRTIKAYETGKWAMVAEGLEPASSYTFTIWFKSDGIEGNKAEESITTSRKTSDYPYIYLKNVTRNDDDSFPSGSRLPLRVYNAFDAKEFVWTFDGQPVCAGADGRYTLTKSGVLEVRILNQDGSENIIMKEIIVKDE